MFATPYLLPSESYLGTELCIPLKHADVSSGRRYSPACTRLLSQYKTMLKLVGDDVPSIDDFMARYRVCSVLDRLRSTLNMS